MKLTLSLAFTAFASFGAIAQQQQPAPQPAPVPRSQAVQPAQPSQNPIPPPGEEQPAAQTTETQPAPQQQTQAQQQGNYISLRVVGSWVRDARGLSLGRVEEVLVNRNNGAAEFAIVAPNSTAATARLVPVPWSMLNYAWDQSQTGGPAGANQVFVANLDAQRLALAPSFDRSRSSTANDGALAAASAFFSAQGSTGSGSTAISGAGGVSATTTSNRPSAILNPDAGIVDTNSLAVVATNGGGTNVAGLRRQTNMIAIPRPGSAPPFTPLTTNQPGNPPPVATTTNRPQPTSSTNSAGVAPISGGQRASGTPVPGAGRPPAQPVNGTGNSGSGPRVPATGGTGSGSGSAGTGTGGSSGSSGGTGSAGGAAGGAGGTR